VAVATPGGRSCHVIGRGLAAEDAERERDAGERVEDAAILKL